MSSAKSSSETINFISQKPKLWVKPKETEISIPTDNQPPTHVSPLLQSNQYPEVSFPPPPQKSIINTEFEANNSQSRRMTTQKAIPSLIIFGVIAVASAILLYLSCVTVEAGHVGVVKRFGAVIEPALQPGFHLVTPFVTSVHEYDTRITSVSHQSTASSMDLQTVSSGVSVQYYINGNSAPKIVQKVGDRSSVENSIISPAIQESVKSVTAKYNAEQLLTQRSKVKNGIASEIENFIKTTLDTKGIGAGVSIANVAVTDFQFSPEFNRAIEMKVKTKQEALQAQNEKTRRITQAEAAKQEKQLAADAEAYKIRKNAEARSNAIKMEADALRNQPQLIQLRLAEKWDGALPKFAGGGDDTSMLLDIDSIMNAKPTNAKSREVRKKLEHKKIG